jgi:hypothetical protein
MARCMVVVRSGRAVAVIALLGCSSQASTAEQTVQAASTQAEPLVPAADEATPAPPRELVSDAPTLAVSPEPSEALPFDGMHAVPLSALWLELEAVAREMDDDAMVQDEYAAFVRTHALEDTPSLRRDYVRVKLVFEATRDGGLWNIRWAITNREPRSTQIWSQWAALAELEPERPTAVAECDELSALFAVIARRLGVDRIGLMWPVWNHVVAVWTVRGAGGEDVRLVVPTSQIFLDRDATLGTDGFNPWKQKTIYTYRSRDVPDALELPAALARFFVQRAREDATRPAAQLQRLRNERSARLGGS